MLKISYKTTALTSRCQGCRLTADLLCYLDYLFENAFSGMTQVKTKHTQSV